MAEALRSRQDVDEDTVERRAIGQILIEMGVVTDEQLQEALATQREKGGVIGQVMVEAGMCTAEDIMQGLATQFGMQSVDLSQVEIDPEAVKMVGVSMAQGLRIVPITFDSGVLTVAMADPQNVNALDDLRFMLNCEVIGAVATVEQITKGIEEHYGNQKESMKDLLDAMDPGAMEVLGLDSGIADPKRIEEMVNAAPVVKFLNLVLLTAIRDQASDIHFEPFEHEFKIRYRIDGTLLEIPPPPRALALALCSRIKVMSNMDIAERRIPQDNRIDLNVGGNPIDLRVSTLPTYFGESVCMRVLDRSVVALDLERLGMRDDCLLYTSDAADE